MKKTLSMLTAISMILCLMVMPVDATETTAVEVSNAVELSTALAEDKDVIFTKDITIEATEGGYSMAGIVQNGETIDGNGYSLTVNGAGGTWDCAVYTQGGTIKNLTIGGAFRGVFTAGCGEDIILDNVILDNVCYTFNSDGANANYSVIIKNSILNGWTSYSGSYKSVAFENCEFGAGTGSYKYAFTRPYSDTTFTDCTFEENYEFDSERCDNKFTDCMVGNRHVNQESVVELLGESAAKVVVLAATHKNVKVEEVKATCTKDGVKSYFECQLCGEVWFDEECQESINSSEDLVIKALGHETTIINAAAATCTTAGYTGDTVCKVCNTTTVAGKEIPATGHIFVDGKCACGLNIKVEAEVTDSVPVTSTGGTTSGTTTEEKVEVPEVKEVTVVETTETKKAEASVKAEATEIVVTVMTEGTDKLVEDKVVTKETAANLEAVTEAINGNGAEMVEKGLLTTEEVKAIEEAVVKGETVVKAEIVVSEVKLETVDTKVQTAIEEKVAEKVDKDAVVAQYLDVSVVLKAAGKELGTIDNLEKEITITVAIPEELKADNREYYVLRNHDGVVEVLPTTLNADGTISFTTDQFSTYALAYAEVEVEATPEGSPVTGDSSTVMTYTVMAVAALAVVVALKKRNLFEK